MCETLGIRQWGHAEQHRGHMGFLHNWEVENLRPDAGTAQTLFSASGTPPLVTPSLRQSLARMGTSREPASAGARGMWTETFTDYLSSARPRTEHDWTIALGRGLGTRISDADATWTPGYSLWRAKAVHAHWGRANVEELMGQLGFNDVIIQSRHQIRGGFDWIVKATRKDDKIVLQQMVQGMRSTHLSCLHKGGSATRTTTGS